MHCKPRSMTAQGTTLLLKSLRLRRSPALRAPRRAAAAEHGRASECDWDACVTFTKETAGGRQAFWNKCARWCCDEKDNRHSSNVLVTEECKTHR
mmetsp:Transcript_102366/g.275192  ORF Transcript_102366/g.275192 Transcript_102366/m.275192 type:complete len:95 (+) Transcript_102366:305-589(+)